MASRRQVTLWPTNRTCTPSRISRTSTPGHFQATGPSGGRPPELNQPGGRIAIAFHARDLHLIMRPPTLGQPIRFQIPVDGEMPGEAHGVDIDQAGGGVLREQRLYNLLRNPIPVRTRHFEIEFLDPGAEAYSFTFG